MPHGRAGGMAVRMNQARPAPDDDRTRGRVRPARRPTGRRLRLRRSALRPGAVVWAVIALTCAVEAVLLASDAGLVGSRAWRGVAYHNGAFYPGLLGNWRPNYAAQPWTMFITYAVLHAGPGHLAGNMLTLISLGGLARERVGPAGFLLLYAVSALGGAAVFGALARPSDPMVGASGALFGLAGAWLRWELMDRAARGRAGWPVLWIALGLVAINLVMWVSLDGLLAWQTHLGGAVMGWIAADLAARAGWGRGLPRRPRAPSSGP